MTSPKTTATPKTAETYASLRDEVDKAVKFSATQDANSDGFVGQYYLKILTSKSNLECRAACAADKDCSDHRFSSAETCHVFETVSACKNRVQNNVCRCRSTGISACTSSIDPACEKKLYRACSSKLDPPALDPCRKKETYMDALPGTTGEWVSTRTCTAIDHRNCAQSAANHRKLLDDIGLPTGTKDVVSMSGNCVLYTNEIAVPSPPPLSAPSTPSPAVDSKEEGTSADGEATRGYTRRAAGGKLPRGVGAPATTTATAATASTAGGLTMTGIAILLGVAGLLVAYVVTSSRPPRPMGSVAPRGGGGGQMKKNLRVPT